MLNSVLSFILALGVLVFLHEFGHYSVARLCKVTVVQFSVGFGKPILRWTNRRTGVLWTVGWIPLGGFVRMLDERDPDSLKGQDNLDHAFNRQHVSKRIAIVLAGPIANLLVAWFLYAALALSQSNQIAPVAATPVEGTAAHAVGLQNNDRVVSINGESTPDWQAVSW
ncbi:MAG: site-2 protease family protein, partial [Limnobacter sp.]|nr:site-2 protease family protein [Limnobacter sp.]